MSHNIRYILRTFGSESQKDQVFKLLQKRIGSKYTNLKIVNKDSTVSHTGPVIKKGDISFLFSYKANLNSIFLELCQNLPSLEWICELWDGEVGLCYIAQNKDGKPGGWNTITDDLEEIEYQKVWDLYFSNPLY